jgi:hypothetical protein
MADDWFRTIVGGLVGGALATAVQWLRYQDDRKVRLRDAYCALDAGLDRLHRSTVQYTMRALMAEPDVYNLWEALHLQVADVVALVRRVQLLDPDERAGQLLEVLADDVSDVGTVLPTDLNAPGDIRLAVSARTKKIRDARGPILEAAKRSIAAL